MNPERPDFLDKKYPDMAGSHPVERAVEKAKRAPERVFAPHERDERVQAYINRLDHIVDSERGWELLKQKLLKEFTIDAEDKETLEKIAHGLYESEKKIATEQGRGADVDRLERETEAEGGILKRYQALVKEKRDIQEKTLSAWLEYLHQNDAEYPTWFRYFVVRNLEKMGTLDKEKGAYSKRTAHTVAPFPELNSEALGFVYRMLTTGIGHQEFTDEPEKREELTKLIAKKDFVKLYTFAQIETAGQLNRESLQGEWIKYNKGSDHHILENAPRGKGTGWCTAEGSAYGHLEGGDFYVYFTKGKSGTYSEPRVAIRMEGDSVAEVRGVNHRQELEPALIDTATAKYHSLPGGDKFDKKSQDMKKVTELVKRQETNQPFTKDDLIFLYEIDAPIEGFGYEKDPRIAELRAKRNPKEDAPIVLDCTKEEIAWSKDDITKTTKSYIGPLFPGIFKLPLEHVYTAFPDQPIKKMETTIGGKTKEQLTQELETKGFKISDYARDMLARLETQDKQEHLDLVCLTVRDIGFPNGATTDEIYGRVEELGLELCPAETGPHLRLQLKDQPMNGWFRIGMKQITDRDGNPNVFNVERGEDGLWLDSNWAMPGGGGALATSSSFVPASETLTF